MLLGTLFLATLVPFTVGMRWRDRIVGDSTAAGGNRLVALVKGWGGEGREREPLLGGGSDERGSNYT